MAGISNLSCSPIRSFESSSYNVRQIVAWLGQIEYFTESVSQDNLAAVQRLANTIPTMPNSSPFTEVIDAVLNVTLDQMQELHDLVIQASDSPEMVDLACPKISVSY